MRSFFLALAISAPFFLFSQKNNVQITIITKSNDSLHFFIPENQMQNPTSLKVWNASSNLYNTYRPIEINGFIIGADDYYISAIVKIDRTPYNEEISGAKYALKESIDTVFLKTEYISNDLKLYSLTDTKRTHFFVQKGNSNIQELIYRKLLINRNGTVYENEDKKFTDQLSDMLADCEQAISGINNIGYTAQSIEKVFNDYNRICHKGDVAKYSKTYKARFEVSVLAGVDKVSLTDKEPALGGGTNNMKLSSFSPIIGARFNYIPALLHYKLSIASDLYYNGFNASSSNYSNYINSSFYTKNTIQLKDQYINLGILLRYYFLREDKTIRPFINIGYLFGFAISTSNKVTTDDFYNNNHAISETDFYPNDGFKKNQFGYIAGVGVAYKKLCIDYRYSGYSNYLSYTSRSLVANSNSIMLAYRLNK